MDVVALSPVLVDRVVWRRDRERWALSVIVKATFDLAPGEVRLSGHPVPISKADVHEAANPSRALSAPSDLVPFKARADVLLVGHAYAPHGRPVSTLTARLAVAGVDKSIAVFGNRIISPRGVGPALPFAKMLLSYERASGGPGTSNPAGMPRGERLPNLEPIGWSQGGSASALRGEVPPPVSFGPIAPSWPERAAKLHAWRVDDPMPEDLDASYFNAAPADQQVGFLRGDETLVMEHLHPDHAMLSTRLAGVVPRAFADRRRGPPEPVEMHADTLWIDTDRRRLSIVWRGDAQLASPDEPGRVLVAMTNAREPLGWEQMQQLYRALSSGSHDAALMDEGDEELPEEAEDEMRSTNAVPAARLPGGALHPEFPGLPSFDDEDSDDDFNHRVDPIGSATRAFAVPGGGRIPDAAPAWLATPSRQAGPLPPRRGPLASRVEVSPKEVAPLPPNADLVWDSPGEGADPRNGPPPFPSMNETTAAPAAYGHDTPSMPFGAFHETAAGPVFAHDTAPPMPFGQPHELPPPPPPAPPPPRLSQMGSQIGPQNIGPMAPQNLSQMGSQIGPQNLSQMGSQVGPPLAQMEENRTGPLPAIQPSAPEPASPWAQGIEPVATAAAVGPMVPLAQPVTPPPLPRPELPERPPPPPPRKAPPRAPSEAVDLVWFDAGSVARIAARYRDLVDDLDMEPLDPDHDLPVDDPAAARDRHHVFGVLTRAPVTDPRGVPGAFRAAIDGHGRFTAPLVIVEGDLVLGLDDRAVLKTTAACAKPLQKDNKRLQDVLAGVDEVMETPLLLGAAGGSDSLLRELLSAVSQSKRALPVKALEEHVERVLLGQRAYQLRTVLGGPQIRAALVPSGGGPTQVTYVPEPVGPKLPLSLRFRARLIAEIHPSPDPLESASLCLRVVAVGRLVPLPGRS